jgi:hypothetical protein
MIVKKLNSPMIISRNLRFIILGDVIFYKQTIIIFFLFPKVHGWKDRRYVIEHFSAKNISFENGIFHSLYKNPKVHGWKDRTYVIGHFSAKNISFEIRKKVKPYIVTIYRTVHIMVACEKCCVNTQQMATCPKMSFFAFCVELLKHDFFMICD